MATGNIKIKSKECKHCKKRMKFERTGSLWQLGDLVMIAITCFAYIPLKIALNALTNPWRCTDCGSR